MRSIASAAALAIAVTLITPRISWAGSAGRRNTALAATALAVGAWSNGTGKAGRKNTAILATAGAAVAWSRYSAKKRQERHRGRYARVASQCVPVACAPAACRPAEECEHHDHGRHLGWYKHRDRDDDHHGWQKHEEHGHHHDD